MLHSEYTIRTERLWEDYFLDPLQWWDDRLKKVRVLACLVKDYGCCEKRTLILKFEVDNEERSLSVR
jgi:hypothetical protein